jgi:N-acetylglucosaminyldiphosphoundecaprenol N-acetyl-beta-D-mannosaminyltransferase
MSLPSVKVLGQPLNLSDDYLSWLIDQQKNGYGSHVVTMNAEMVIQAKNNHDFHEVLNKADLVVPDGSGVILYLTLNGIKQTRFAGIELAQSLLRYAESEGENCPVFFYGGKPEVVVKAVEKWQRELPNLTIAGYQHGYINEEEHSALINQLQQLQPKIILVAIGAPKQEFWINQHKSLCSAAIWVGVGGSFDVWSGTKTRAPKFIQKIHLEWLYRLAQEPKRWKRIFALPKFMILTLMEKI